MTQRLTMCRQPTAPTCAAVVLICPCRLPCVLQEEYLLNPSSTMRLVARLAKEGGVAAVSDAVYPYLSLAAETFLAQLLNNMVKMRLQREDLGR